MTVSGDHVTVNQDEKKNEKKNTQNREYDNTFTTNGQCSDGAMLRPYQRLATPRLHDDFSRCLHCSECQN